MASGPVEDALDQAPTLFRVGAKRVDQRREVVAGEVEVPSSSVRPTL